tara:strand:- start:790 stop:945 length:156 start_codon:yes stop_codon:yes gene_type:complete
MNKKQRYMLTEDLNGRINRRLIVYAESKEIAMAMGRANGMIGGVHVAEINY